jgi:hypothetical protein
MSEIRVSSTTDPQAEVTRAADADAIDFASAREIKISSSTDSESAILEAGGPEIAELTGPDKVPRAVEQHNNRPKPAFQKRIDKLVKEREALKERLRKYEPVAESSVRTEERTGNVAGQGETQSESTDPAVALDSALLDFLRQHANGAEVEEFLQGHPAAFNELRLMSPQQASAQIGRIGEFLEQQAVVEDTYRARTDEARQKYRDFDRVAYQDIPIWEGIRQLILKHESGPELQYFLGANPAVAQELMQVPPEIAIGHAGALLEQFASGESSRNARSSGPPAPIRPVGNSLRPALPDEDKMSFSEYKHARESGRIGLSAASRRTKGYGV